MGMFHGVLLRFEAVSGIPQFRMPAMNRFVDESLSLDLDVTVYQAIAWVW